MIASVVNHLAHTTNERTADEASFRRPMSEQDRGSEYNAERLGSVTTRSTMSTNERCRSSSSTLPTVQYNEAAILCFKDSLPSASRFNISTKKSHHLKNSTHTQQQSKGRRNQPSCLRTGWAQTIHTRELYALQLCISQRITGKISVRQYST
ncbi:hypothetical protein FHG87_013062 [Trinorchestia longiramus]|nr:hypothetical protein FHG87_013062 [Trinorchestia longiramus]